MASSLSFAAVLARFHKELTYIKTSLILLHRKYYYIKERANLVDLATMANPNRFPVGFQKWYRERAHGQMQDTIDKIAVLRAEYGQIEKLVNCHHLSNAIYSSDCMAASWQKK